MVNTSCKNILPCAVWCVDGAIRLLWSVWLTSLSCREKSSLWWVQLFCCINPILAFSHRNCRNLQAEDWTGFNWLLFIWASAKWHFLLIMKCRAGRLCGWGKAGNNTRLLDLHHISSEDKTWERRGFSCLAQEYWEEVIKCLTLSVLAGLTAAQYIYSVLWLLFCLTAGIFLHNSMLISRAEIFCYTQTVQWTLKIVIFKKQIVSLSLKVELI